MRMSIRSIFIALGLILLPVTGLSWPGEGECKDGAWQDCVGGQTMHNIKLACMEGNWRDFGFKNPGHCVKAVNQGDVMVWSLSGDFPRYPDNVNPAPDQYGNAGVWHYRYSIGLGHPWGTYLYYYDYFLDWSGIEEAWTAGSEEQFFTPLLGIPDYTEGAVLHPTSDSLSLASWRSPIDGTVGIKGHFSDVQPGCGYGVEWAIDHKTARRVTAPDQGQIFGTDGEVELGMDIWSQSITTGTAGQLSGIQFQIHWGPLPGDFNFAIVSGGNPATGPVLFFEQVTVTPDDLDGASLYTWDVSLANLVFDAGDVFTFVIHAQQDGFNIAGNSSPGYAGGDLFKNGILDSEVGDIAFFSLVTTATGPDIALTMAEGRVRNPPGYRNERFDFKFDIPVLENDYLDFIVGPGFRDDDGCDTTQAVITIVGPLTKD